MSCRSKALKAVKMGAKNDRDVVELQDGRTIAHRPLSLRRLGSLRSSFGKQPGKISSTELRDLLAKTHFTEEELKSWYSGFRRDCPNGRLTQEQFMKMYGDFYGTAEAGRFAEHLFRTFDANGDGTIDFKEFICSLSVTTRGTMEEKLRWAFEVYDVDHDGVITKHELLSIVKSINKMLGNINNKNASEERILRIFAEFDKNNDDMLSLDEFIAGARKDKILMQMLQWTE